MKERYWSIRRRLLKNLVPEWIWPKEACIDGVTFAIRHTPYSYGTKKALKSGNYEVSERRLLRNFIKEGDIVFEMGGSIGVLTAILGKMVGDDGMVISIEASETISGYSQKWLPQKGNIKVLTGFAFPVFSVKHKVNIMSFDEEAGSLGGKLSFTLQDCGDVMENKVNHIFDIHRIIELYGVYPSALVVDVEGSERIIALNKPDFPSSVKTILMEMHTFLYGEETRDRIIKRIRNEGFKVEKELQGVYLFIRG